ncbi:hypothetical protein F5Y00DRAFT_200357 [Daldinia vernicosa]|uniref:uncharacterized protein n=1 Tax=Daldinia vernicosa TaxID=114800 RepID=UPI00200787D9|nr:uncharacterized protein F5Y00DRAFT_200357 [Daldinia vernicosa]KAI0844362.1 hypothetical protein F5Y00DRAFT_200357 [Daldinia vernicosa]
MELSKVAIIAAPTKEPRAVTNPSSSVVAIFVPTLVVILRCQRVLAAASLSLHIKVSWLARHLSQVLRIFASQIYSASKLFRYHTAILGRTIWKTKPIQRLRKKIVFEFFTLMLGSCGNLLCLLLFWPGWWLLGIAWLVVRWLTG